MYSISLSDDAKVAFERADRPLAKKLMRCFDTLKRDPVSHPMIKMLTGEFAGRYRYRVGDRRVIYEVNHESRAIVVVQILHRRDAYD